MKLTEELDRAKGYVSHATRDLDRAEAILRDIGARVEAQQATWAANASGVLLGQLIAMIANQTGA